VANNIALTLNENNDEDVIVTIKTNVPVDNTVLNLTGTTVEAFLKQSASISDTDASTWKGSSAGSGVALTDPTNGICTVSIPAASVLTSMHWWRVDVISAGKRKTAVFGAVSVQDL
jgi:hypothetical protein